MKLFYLINEPTLNYQVGYREAIRKLIETGDLRDCVYYSFQVKLIEFNFQWDLVTEDITKRVADFRPDAILFAHTGHNRFNKSFFNRLQQILGYKPTYALDERDAYGRFSKMLPNELLALSRKCDITFLSSSGGWLFDQFKRSNPGKILYLPQCCDDIHFGTKRNGSPSKYDIVMIGNLVRSKVPFNSMPGVRNRIKVAEALYKRHGKKFAVFGFGWQKYPFSEGPVSFFEQEKVLHSSHSSVGVDHFLSYDQYYSDRLPIALFSGTPHLSWKTPRLDLMFKEGKHIHFFESVEEAIKKSDALLSGKNDQLPPVVSEAVVHIKDHYIETVRMKRLIKYLDDLRTAS